MGSCTSSIAMSNIFFQDKKFQDNLSPPHEVKGGTRSACILAKYAKKVNVLDNFVTWIEKNALLIALALTQKVLNLSSF